MADVRRNAMPVLYTSGTHYEVGLDIGHTFGGLIKSFLGSFSYFQKELLPAYATDLGRANFDASLATAKERYPQYVREVEGMAEGSGVPLHHLLLLNLDRLVQGPQQGTKPEHGCSTIMCNNEGQVLLGHTEDALDEVLNHIYLVSATICDGTSNEVFTSLCYAGYLPGFCMSYNQHGFVYSINVLFPHAVQPGKSPPYFLTRRLLSASNAEEAEAILRDEGVGTGDGFNVNMCFVKKEGAVEFFGVEVAPSTASNSEISKITISPGENFIHTNKYLRLKVEEDTEYEENSSQHRLTRAAECPAPNCKQSLLNILSDDNDKEYPFFRHKDESGVTTVTLGVFDLLEKSWTFYMGNPKTWKPLVSLPLRYQWDK